MAGLDFSGDTPKEQENEAVVARNSIAGLWLFLVYVLFYGGFVWMSAFKYKMMSEIPFGGANVAVLYGFSLIASAFVLALIYLWLCSRPMNNSL